VFAKTAGAYILENSFLPPSPGGGNLSQCHVVGNIRNEGKMEEKEWNTKDKGK
jgi:hypothetical protein